MGKAAARTGTYSGHHKGRWGGGERGRATSLIVGPFGPFASAPHPRRERCRPLSALAMLMALVVLGFGVASSDALAVGDANRTSCDEFPQSETSPGFRTYLPDCRAYEMVSPPFKDGWPIAAGLGASHDGSSFVATSFGDFAGGTGNDSVGGNAYLFTRGASSWLTTPLNPPLPRLVERTGQPEGQPLEGPGVSPTGATLFVAHEATQSVYQSDLYEREAGGTFALIGPLLPPSAVPSTPAGTSNVAPEGEELKGSSSDLSHVIFSIVAGQNLPPAVVTNLWPVDGTKLGNSSLYEYEYRGTPHSGIGGDTPKLVALDNAANQSSQCGSRVAVAPGTSAPGISSGGSTVLVNIAAGPCAEGGTGPAVAQLLARVGNPAGPQTTINVAGSSGCAGAVVCNVVVPPVYQGASQDASRVFFTSTQQLTPSDHDTTNDLYECELPGDRGMTPTPSGVVNSCPTLRPVSVTATAIGAEVQGVVALSEDGSHVYYVATGVVTAAANVYGAKAASGANNLYAYNAVTRETRFVGAIASTTATAQATPDGRFLVFADSNQLTPDDTSSSVPQIFEYDAATGNLVRVSIGQKAPGGYECPTTKKIEEGFNCNGNGNSLGAEIFEPSNRVTNRSTHPNVTDDGGKVVFTSANGLTPQALNGRCVRVVAGECFEFAKNVYEYSAGNVYLISDGRAVPPNQVTELSGIDGTGRDIFFTTVSQLVPQDTDQAPDLYDAREAGGFPSATSPVQCEGDACQGAVTTPPLLPVPASATAVGEGNLSVSPAPIGKPPSKPQSAAQKLAQALRACRSKPRARRRACERAARGRYRAAAGNHVKRGAR